MSEDLFGPLFVPGAMRAAVGGRAWLAAMLEAEAALARAQARVGLVPPEAAEAIAFGCAAGEFDVEEIGARGRASGNPVPPLVRALTAAVPERAAPYVHAGATSQDIMDTAAMLVARRATDLVLADLDGLAAAAARLAEGHRETMMPARTLMQQALPTTFGLKASVWLVAVLEARRVLVGVRSFGLAAQLGGAAGTLASLGPDGPGVLREFARELDLAEPAVPWHAARGRVAGIGNALAVVAGAAHKVALDVVLMSQTEVGEVSEASGGGSSTLPHKRNPALSTLAIACARRVPPLAATLQASMAQEHERAAGAWHAEWETMSEAFAMTDGAVAAVREALDGLEVHPGRMRVNLEATNGLILTERISSLLSQKLGRLEAHDLVEEVARRAARGTPLREALLAEPSLRGALSEDELDDALDPTRYLGSAREFVDRALTLYREETG